MNESCEKKSGGVPMRELEKISGFTRATINYYIKEGLLPAPRKSAKNMAYYDSEFIARLKKVKILKDDCNFSLKQIKEMFGEHKIKSSRDFKIKLLKGMNEIMPFGKQEEPVTLSQMMKETGLDETVINELYSLGIINSVDNNRTLYPSYAMTICKLFKYFLDLGIPTSMAKVFIDKFMELIQVEAYIYGYYVIQPMRKKNMPEDAQVSAMKESLKAINTLLPMLQLQLMKLPTEECFKQEQKKDGNLESICNK